MMERMQEQATVNAETRQISREQTSATAMSKRSSHWGLRIWKRCSPLQLLRFIRDTYVTGCVTAGNNVYLGGMAKHAAIFQMPDDAFSRQSSLRGDDEAHLVEALSRQSSRNEAQGQQKTIAPILFTIDQPARFSHSVSVKPTSFESPAAGPDLERQFKNRQSSDVALSDLLRTSNVHRTALLRSSPSKRVASLESYNTGNPVKLDLKKTRSSRSNISAARFSTSDVPIGIAANPFRTVDALGHAPGRMSVDLLSGRISPDLELVRATSIVEDSELSYIRTSSASRSLKLKVTGFEEFKRSKSRKANQPNPYSFYDCRLPSKVVNEN